MTKYSKFIAAAIGCVILVANTIWGSDSNVAHAISIIVGILTSLGVYSVENK
jgi:hypothetical protein